MYNLLNKCRKIILILLSVVLTSVFAVIFALRHRYKEANAETHLVLNRFLDKSPQSRLCGLPISNEEALMMGILLITAACISVLVRKRIN